MLSETERMENIQKMSGGAFTLLSNFDIHYIIMINMIIMWPD